MKTFLATLALSATLVTAAFAEDCLYPATTLVTKVQNGNVVLAGTPVCALYVVPGAARADGAELIAVLTPKVAGSFGATNVVVEELRYFSDELKGR